MAFPLTAGAPPRWMRPPAALRRVRARLRHLGAAPLVLLGFVAKLGWAFFGSLGLGSGLRGEAIGGSAPLAWLASPEDGRRGRC